MSSLSKQTMQLQNAQLERAKAPILQAMKNITDRQEKQHQIEDYAAQFKANCGKDRFANGKSMLEGMKDSFNNWTKAGKGKVSNATLDMGYMIPAVLEKQMLNHWMKENPLMPNIYAANRYGQSALQTLNRLRVNPYNQLQALNQNDRAAYYRMQQNGGYTGGQRQAGRVALALGNARNVADVLNNADLQNNKYRQDWATAALAEGNQDAVRRQAANQYAWEAYNRAHGAKTKGIETHLSNLGLIGQKWLSQRIKNKQYGDILDMYQQDIDNKNAALKAIYGIGGDSAGSSTGGNTTQRQSRANTNPDTIPIRSRFDNIAPGWTPSQYSPFSGTPNVPYQSTGINRGVLGLKYDDYSINKLNAPYGKYWFVDTDRVADLAKSTRNWAKSKEQYQRGAFGTPYERVNFSSDYTGGFGPNGLFQPTWAGGFLITTYIIKLV